MNKIFDIIPPSEKGESPKVEIKKEKIKTSKIKKERKPLNLPKFSFSNKLILPLVAVFILLVIMSSLIFSKVDIVITPKMEILTFETELKVSSLNSAEKDIDGMILDKTENVSKEFNSTGKSLKKAEGTIRVYNLYSSNSLTFREGTRFMSDSGKIFTIKNKAVIPGKPEYIDLKVVAAEAGSDYNIEASMFSIPGLAGSAMYDRFYGRSFNSMSGGGEFAQVSEEDLKIAKDQTIKEFTSVIGSKLVEENSLDQDYLILDDAFDVNIDKSFSLAKVGDESETFKYTIQGEGKVMIFKKSDVERFATEYILSELINMDIQPDSLDIKYVLKDKDLNSGQISFNLEIKANVFPKIDEGNIKENIYAKSEEEVKAILSSSEGIVNSSVSFWPFWINRIPKNTKRVDIILNLE
jgi:hypothetical protein